MRRSHPTGKKEVRENGSLALPGEESGHTRAAKPIPREARGGLTRAWLDILHQRHPGVTWIPAETVEYDDQPERQASETPADFTPPTN
jgi:hypothetical protein